jgi:hypothetical protein
MNFRDEPEKSFSISELLGYSRLTVDATIGVTNLVEAMHNNTLNSELADKLRLISFIVDV